MKPVIIYSLPRTRSTAALQACNRIHKYNEPFDLETLFSKNNLNIKSELYNSVSAESWRQLFSKLDDKNSVSKFFGNSLYHCLPARQWWEKIQDNDSHDIFVLTRNLEEVFLSNVIARQINTYVKSDVVVPSFVVSKIEFYVMELLLDSFLRFMPQKRKMITFETLPTNYFDKSRISHINQESSKEYCKILNYDETVFKIKEIIRYYQHDLDKIMMNTGD